MHIHDHSTQMSYTKDASYCYSSLSLIISWAVCEYIQSTHWLATGYVIDQTWKDRSLEMSTSSETPLRTRTLPSQNACRYRLDGMGTRLAPMFSAISVSE